ncbi:hypothetical protein AAFF_G00317270 [Aldrovandia affinis]|uniref:Uncharacterized protein n=1 Tax=Aldrovandia affinis TaxID=143900 RepID=A0AAD7W0A2_9TELE|nr:hypothetical protein AAFF_G00317270 [Aldrovandia affinis]
MAISESWSARGSEALQRSQGGPRTVSTAITGARIHGTRRTLPTRRASSLERTARPPGAAAGGPRALQRRGLWMFCTSSGLKGSLTERHIEAGEKEQHSAGAERSGPKERSSLQHTLERTGPKEHSSLRP